MASSRRSRPAAGDAEPSPFPVPALKERRNGNGTAGLGAEADEIAYLESLALVEMHDSEEYA